MVNNYYLYLNKFGKIIVILQVKYILNENGEPFTHQELTQKYNIKISFLQTI